MDVITGVFLYLGWVREVSNYKDGRPPDRSISCQWYIRVVLINPETLVGKNKKIFPPQKYKNLLLG